MRSPVAFGGILLIALTLCGSSSASFYPPIPIEHQQHSVAELAAKLLAAGTEPERRVLLETFPSLVNRDLVRAIITMGDQNPRQAEEAYLLAVRIAKDLPDKMLIGIALAAVARNYWHIGKTEPAIKTFREARSHAVMAKDLNLLVQIDGGWAECLLDMGKPIAALEKAKQAAEEASKNSQESRGDALAILGRARVALSLYRDAFAAFRDAEIAYTGATSPKKVVALLNEEAAVYSDSGRPDQSLPLYDRALALLTPPTEKNRYTRAQILLNKGYDQALSGSPAEGVETLKKSIEMLREGDPDHSIVSAYLNEAVALKLMGDLASAEVAVRKAYDIAANSQQEQAKRPLHYVRLEYAKILSSKQSPSPSEIARAVDLVREALKDTNMEDANEVWSAYLELGNAYLAGGNKKEALENFMKAIEVIDRLVSRLGDDPEAVVSFLTDKIDIYEGISALLAEENKPLAALLALEKARARGLLNVIEKGSPQPRQGMRALDREREATLKARLAEANEALLQNRLNQSADQSKLNRLASTVEIVRSQWTALRFELGKKYPGINRDAQQVAPLSDTELVELVKDDETVVLEYTLSSIKAFGFVIARTPQGTLDVRTFSLGDDGEKLKKKLDAYYAAVSSEHGGDYLALGKDLYNVLVSPAESLLAGKRHVVIVPTAELWRVPFQALILPDERFFVEKYAVSYVPSLSVLRDLRRKPAFSGTANKRILALVDPAVRNNPAGAKDISVNRSKSVLKGTQLKPLSILRDNATRLRKALGPKRCKLYTGTRGTEARFRKGANAATTIYLGAHGIVDDDAPLYSRIVLVGTGGNTNSDGVLEAWEVVEMHIPASLVILAACDTANGSIKPGEGIIGLSWAFSIAGCPRLVASLWEIPEPSTAALMDILMKRLFDIDKESGHKSGRSPDIALQGAAAALLANPHTRHPWHWAAFELIGDYR